MNFSSTKVSGLTPILLDILTLSEVINSNLISSNIGNLTGSENTKLRYVALGIEVDTPQ